MELNPDFLDIVAALREEGADFLVVGAFAMAAHGVPRGTGGLDLWIRPVSGHEKDLLDVKTLEGQ